MATTKRSLEQFLARPDDTKPAREYVCGTIWRKPVPDNAHSALQLWLGALLLQFLATSPLGRVWTEWRCIFGPAGAERAYVPDVVYASYERMPAGDARRNRYLYTAPDLAVEVLSCNHRPGRLASKIAFYLQHGVRLVWVVDPDDELVYVYAPGQPHEILKVGDTLSGGEVLPGFRVVVADLFAQLQR